MKFKLNLLLLLPVVMCNLQANAQNFWTKTNQTDPQKEPSVSYLKNYLVYKLDEADLRSKLAGISTDPANGKTIELPTPDGSMKQFTVWQTPMMPPALAEKYPEIRTFTAVSEDQRVTAKLDVNTFGFHAMIYDGERTSFIDPYDKTKTGYYIIHYKRDEIPSAMRQPLCQVSGNEISPSAQHRSSARASARTSHGTLLRTYRLALSANTQYSKAVTGHAAPTISEVLGEMTKTLNRINGVYERELSISLTFVTNEDQLIWTKPTGSVNGDDPFYAIDASPTLCNSTNQSTCDTKIGNANYDIGHVFTTGAGGYSQVGVVCLAGEKAQSCTGQPAPYGDGFDIDFVAHEMGHQFGADHTFNGSIGNCSGNINNGTAYEPGSGSTIMAYAGICGSDSANNDNLALHSDAYFHAISLLQIQDFITTNTGDLCPVKTLTNNKPVSLAHFSKAYSIPALTPFELSAPAALDSVSSSSITYCWEQWNLGDVGQKFDAKYTEFGPIFRSYSPAPTTQRIFPRNELVLANKTSDVGKTNAKGEKLPDISRHLTFRTTVRNIYMGTGCFLFPDDSVFVDVINTQTPFVVTSQNSPGQIYKGNSTQNITWDVAKTNEWPLSTTNVDIYMSADGGDTWPYHIGNYINNGSAFVTLPNPDTTIAAARIKVKGADNIFFNVNATDFSVEHGDPGDTTIVIKPVPVHSTLRISSGNKGLLHTTIFTSAGQQIWSGDINGEQDIAVDYWARGMYIIRMIDLKKQRTVKKIVVD